MRIMLLEIKQDDILYETLTEGNGEPDDYVRLWDKTAPAKIKVSLRLWTV